MPPEYHDGPRAAAVSHRPSEATARQLQLSWTQRDGQSRVRRLKETTYGRFRAGEQSNPCALWWSLDGHARGEGSVRTPHCTTTLRSHSKPSPRHPDPWDRTRRRRHNCHRPAGARGTRRVHGALPQAATPGGTRSEAVEHRVLHRPPASVKKRALMGFATPIHSSRIGQGGKPPRNASHALLYRT